MERTPGSATWIQLRLNDPAGPVDGQAIPVGYRPMAGELGFLGVVRPIRDDGDSVPPGQGRVVPRGLNPCPAVRTADHRRVTVGVMEMPVKCQALVMCLYGAGQDCGPQRSIVIARYCPPPRDRPRVSGKAVARSASGEDGTLYVTSTLSGGRIRGYGDTQMKPICVRAVLGRTSPFFFSGFSSVWSGRSPGEERGR